MNKKILICTIVRDSATHLPAWWTNLAYLIESLPFFDFEVGVFENDSIDGSGQTIFQLIKRYPLPRKTPVHFSSETLNTKKYPSVWSLDRLRNLAHARNRCLEIAGNLGRFGKICYIEPDITYDAAWLRELIEAKHPNSVGIEPDIYSAWSLRTLSNPKESVFLYDTCATRQTENCKEWNFERDSEWRGRSLVKTNLGGHNNNCLHSVFSTFNGFCVYNSRPFIQGLRWDYRNKRLDNGQQKLEDGSCLEADTVSVCEDFRSAGYNNVFLNTNCLVRHE